MSRVSSHNAHDICTDLENILDRICPLRTLEMAFQSTKISDPPSDWPLHCSPDSSVIKKQKNTILYT